MKSSVPVLLTILLVGFISPAHPQGNTADTNFLGTYEELQPAQKKLVDEWYAEYNRVAGDHLSSTDYNHLPVSTRTTFEAVTHALLTTNLTDNSGNGLGKALDFVQAIETVSGKVPKARGDLQFRVYVLLTSAALDTLKQCNEFYRDHDNTVFHRGYPINYRQGGGEPSIQVSISKDSRHADIDVDYRSSKFPMALFNGHLRAANSDVRAGNNTQRHIRRWIGLSDWWRDLFGLPSAQETVSATQEGEIPAKPRKGTAKLDVAVEDFLSAWLTEKKPERAAAYLSSRSFPCLEEYGPQAGTQLNFGLARYAAAKDMAATLALTGKADELQDVVTAFQIQNDSFRTMKQPSDATFSLAQVTNRAAAELECDPQRAYEEFDRFRSAGSLGKFGGYYTSTFRLRAPNESSDGITLLWAKESKNWRIVAWNIEPEEQKPDRLPDTRSPKSPATGATFTAGRFQYDPGFQLAVSDFFRTWLIRDDFAKAATYFSPRCYGCVELYLDDGQTPPFLPEDQARYIQNSLAAVGNEIGLITRLEEALEPVPPEGDDLKLMSHADKGAYSLVALPDYLADSFLCTKHSKKSPYQAAASGSATYGNYYAAIFELRTPGDHASAVTLLWQKQDSVWRIVAYELMD